VIPVELKIKDWPGERHVLPQKSVEIVATETDYYTYVGLGEHYNVVEHTRPMRLVKRGVMTDILCLLCCAVVIECGVISRKFGRWRTLLGRAYPLILPSAWFAAGDGIGVPR